MVKVQNTGSMELHLRGNILEIKNTAKGSLNGVMEINIRENLRKIKSMGGE